MLDASALCRSEADFGPLFAPCPTIYAFLIQEAAPPSSAPPPCPGLLFKKLAGRDFHRFVSSLQSQSTCRRRAAVSASAFGLSDSVVVLVNGGGGGGGGGGGDEEGEIHLYGVIEGRGAERERGREEISIPLMNSPNLCRFAAV